MDNDFLTIGEVFAEFIGEYDKEINQYIFKGPFLGGKPAIFSKIISKLKRKICFISCVSDDKWGNFIIDEINKSNINSSHLRKISDYNTPISFIIKNDSNCKNNFFLKNTSATQIFFNDINKEFIRTAKYFYISVSSLLYSKRVRETIFEITKNIKNSTKIALSFCNINEVKITPEDKKILQPFFELANLLFINNQDADIIFEEPSFLIKKLLKKNAKTIILKNLNIPYKIITNDHTFDINFQHNLTNENSFYINEVFNAGFLIGQLKGLNESLSLRFALTLLTLYTSHENTIPSESEIIRSLSL